jgi:hypothetical protein
MTHTIDFAKLLLDKYSSLIGKTFNNIPNSKITELQIIDLLGNPIDTEIKDDEQDEIYRSMGSIFSIKVVAESEGSEIFQNLENYLNDNKK